MKTKVSFIITLLISFISYAQSIEKFSVDSGGASASAGGIQILYTIGETNVQELSVGGLQVSEGFINANFKIKIDPKLFLQGPILNPVTAGLMNDNLRSGSLIPTTSPYADGATCNASVFSVTGPNAIVDWVWVELRAANNNTKLINGKPALLQRDGDVVGVDGVSNLIMNAAPTNYYVVVNHRNHNGSMTSGVIGINETTPTIVDFRSNALPTYGSNARALLASGSMALWAGDAGGSNYIRFSGANNSTNAIKDYVLADPANSFNSVTFSSAGYFNIDINLDGIGKFSGPGNDSNIIKDNVLAHPGNGFNSPTFTINPTVPTSN